MVRLLATALVLALGVATAARPAAAQEGQGQQPNVVFILGDDITFSDVPVWGGTNVETPNLDRLASEGMTFDKAYVTSPACTPTRAALYTGLNPFNNGVAWNHGLTKPGVKSWGHYFGDAGYRVGIAGKRDTAPDDRYPWEIVGGVTGNSVADVVEFSTDDMQSFVTRDEDQPFVLAVGLTNAHVPWTAGDPESLDPDSFDLPPHLPNHPGVRRAFASYLAEIEDLDREIGAILDLLDEENLAENTIVMFCSEQGAQMPGAKWNLYDIGTHTGVIVRWPGVVEAGTRTDAIVQDIDVTPTLLEAVGAPVPEVLDGESFLPVLEGEADEAREYAYTMHNNVPEGPPFPIRAITDGEHTYIENLAPDHAYLIKFMMGGDGRDSGLWNAICFAGHTHPLARTIIDRTLIRPAEEFYNVNDDPAMMNNLIGDESHADKVESLKAKLHEWREANEDAGVEMDTQETFQEWRREAQNG